MRRVLISAIAALFAITMPNAAPRISDVNVDFLKGYAKDTNDDGDTVYYYMGRLTYHLLADGKDSIFVDFKIVPKGTDNALPLLQILGDVGLVKQKNGADTLKTAYFRTALTNETSGEYVGVVSADAQSSLLWRMADSLAQLMSPEQKELMLYTSQTDPIYTNFGQDNSKLPDGSIVFGWRSADGPHGIRYPLGESNDIAIYGAGDTVTLFPTEASLGCSWDPSLTYRVGEAIGKEARAKGLYCILGPMCDLVVNPRWGRAFETMGEDPCLVGTMTQWQVKGLQSVRVIATPKHFTPYVTENERMILRVVLEERALRELFCEPFRMCLQDGGAHAIMTCYHRVRSEGFTTTDQTLLDGLCDRASTNRHLINTILRNDWGFNGIIMTDWEGAKGVQEKYSFETEYDMSMPKGDGGFYDIAENISSGAWSVDPLNKKAARIIHEKLWAWDGKLITTEDEIKTYDKSTIMCEEHFNIALEAARKGIVLAKNEEVDGTRILPLDKNGSMTIAVVGPYAKMGRPGGGGSSAVTPDKIITPMEGITDLVAGNSDIVVTDNYDNADVAVVCVGVERESEDYDRPSMQLPGSQEDLVEAVKNKVKKTIVVYTGGSASAAGTWSSVPGVVIAFYPGKFQGKAVAEILFGDVNPSGHLNVTFPQTADDLPSYEVKEHIFTCSSVDSAFGYFFFEKSGKTPLYWFGHGLSYTTFTYDNIRLGGPSSLSAGDRIDVHVTLTNSGDRAGSDVVQLYVKPKCGSMPRRVKDLRAFQRVELAAAETKTVHMVLGPHDFSVYTPDTENKTGKWEVVPGEYEILAGSTSDPAVLSAGEGQSVKTTISVN